MAYDGETIIKDDDGNPIPQIWDKKNKEWIAYLFAPKYISEKIKIMLMKTPGRSEPLPDTYDKANEAAWFGEVTADELITGPDLSDEFSLTAGTEFNTSSGWMKYMYQGRICFMAKKPFRYGISWDDIADGSNGTTGSNELVYGSNTITINGIEYRVRLMEGGNAIDDNTEWGFDEKDYGANEWQTVMFNLVDCTTDGHLGEYNWTNANEELYHNDEEGAGEDQGAVGIGGDNGPDGRATWCQEHEGDDPARRVHRGHHRVAYFGSLDSDNSYSNRGWRPVLEVVG